MNSKEIYWRKQFMILTIFFIIIFLILVMIINIQSQENKKVKKASMELIKAQVGFLNTCMEISNISLKEIQMVYFDEKIKEIREELLNG